MEIGEGGATAGLVFAAGVCSEAENPEDEETRRYAIALLREFFRKKGGGLVLPDYGRMLFRTFHHIHNHVVREMEGRGAGMDLAVAVADTSTVCVARSGGGGFFIYHEGEAHSLFAADAGGAGMIGSGSTEIVEVREAPLQPGDIAVLCDPVISRVIGPRDVAVILRRASDPAKASLFLSAIAERKGAAGPVTALLWEVPNYQGAALLTDETPAERPPHDEDKTGQQATGEEDTAEFAKRQWLSKWRRHKE